MTPAANSSSAPAAPPARGSAVGAAALVGRVLNGRYRLLAPLGAGASGQVLLADDVALRRRVAVKVLHPALAADGAFLRRFRAEAQAAAALNHPNILAVYDWGEDGLPFLVSELLGGGSLRAVLDSGRLLTPSQALVVGLDACRGLHYAHGRGIVHRDIKPANLIFGEDRRLRIADFGLARALAEAAWTEPEGVILGTARYASPEQADGAELDAKSDVYSLALVLVEAVTGEAPHAAGTVLATLRARSGRAIDPPAELGALRKAVALAGRADPNQRVDARGFGLALMRAAEALPRPTPLPLAPPPSPVPGAAGEATELGGPPFEEAPRRLARAAARPAPPPPPAAPGEGAARRPAEPAAPPRSTKAAPPRRVGRGRRRLAALLAALGAAAAAGAGGVALSARPLPAPRLVPVGAYVGQPVATITPELDAAGWTLTTRLERRDGTTAGEVLEQSSPPGGRLRQDRELTLVVSGGETLVTPPEGLVGQPQPAVEQALAAVSLTVGQVAAAHHEEIPAGSVIAIAQQGAALEKGAPVDLTVSQGPAPRQVPGDLVGLQAAEAAARLEALGLKPKPAGEYSETAPEGVVVSVKAAPGAEVAKGAEIGLVVSKGPAPVQVPRVAGLQALEATARLRAAGLTVSEVDGPPDTQVLATDPPAGETVRKGARVRIITRRS